MSYFWRFYCGLMVLLLTMGIATGLWIEVFILITGFGIGLPICHILEFID